VGKFFLDFFAVKIAFSWGATVLAAAAISFPLMYRSARGALEQVDPNLIYTGRTLGLSEWIIFLKVSLPTALPGIASGGVLAFARGLGEFGATAMIAGNIAGRTRTLPLAIYSAVAAGDMDTAYNYVLVIVIFSFFVVALMNYFTAWDGQKRDRKIRR
jgi:molybdate transport system permease protein